MDNITDLEEVSQLRRVLEEEIYKKFIITDVDENGLLNEIRFINDDKFNFSFDVMDVLGTKCSENPAMLYISKNGGHRYFTFGEMMSMVGRAANYFVHLGIKRGDRVMLVLKRHYQFWVSILALHKIGAIAIPATSQLQTADLEYRFKFGGISAIVSTCEDNIPAESDEASANGEGPSIKVSVGGKIDGWHCFDEEYTSFDDKFERSADSPCGSDSMMMFFTSGTTGYPKIVEHDFRYGLSHFVTAKYWHGIQPGDMHMTVADTGWGKAVWGMLYGQWLCGAVLCVYDFDRFSPTQMLSTISDAQINTFCAPPTAYRMMIKEHPENYDLSSIRRATTAGECLNPEVFTRFKEATGIEIMEGFGQTETPLIIGTIIGMTPKPGSMGKPAPPFNVGLINNNGEPCKAGEEGEIILRADENRPCGLFKRYYHNDDLTETAWKGGVYHTGDIAKFDEDGYFWYVGRCDDVIKSSGYKIGPAEVEHVIMELPYVVECAVSGEKDEIRGQIIKASIVLTKGTEPTEELKTEIQSYVKSKTAPYKYPRKVCFMEELPKTISGKVIRSML